MVDPRVAGPLRLESKQFDALLENLPAATFRVDPQGLVAYANPAAERLLGLTRSTFEGRRYDQPPVEVTRPDGAPLDFADSPVPRALRGEKVEAFEAALRLPGEDEARIFCFDASPIREPDGGVAGALVTAREITAEHKAKQALKSSQRRLDSVLNNTTMAVFVMDERQQCIYANAAAEKLTGYAFSEMQGRPLHNVIHHTHPDGRAYPLEECPIDRAFPENFQVQGEEVFVHKDGSFYPVAFTASPIRDEASNTIGTVIEARSVAEERLREAQLTESEARFRNMADHAPMMMWVTEADGACSYLNRAWYEFTGQTPETGLGFGWLDAVHEDDREWSGQTFLAANEKREAFRLEYRLRRRDGTYRWALDAASPRFAPDGAFLGYIGSVIDIDERHEAETRVRESEARLQALMNVAPSFMWYGGPDGSIKHLNERWYEYTGQETEQALGAGWADAVHPDDRAEAGAKWAAAVASGASYEVELRYRRRDGEHRWYVARAEPLRDASGEVTGWFGASTDIHDLKVTDEVLRETEERYRLALLATQDAIWDWDLVKNHVLWNEALQTAHGHDLSTVEPTGQWWIEHIHPDDRARVDTSIHAVIDGDGSTWAEEYRFLRADGTYADILDRGRVIRDAQGKAVRMIGAMLDLTEQKRQQAALRESEATLRSLTEAMPNMAWITRPDGSVEWFNARWYEYTGSPAGADLGHAWADYLHPQDRDQALEKWLAAATAGVPFENEHRFRAADGSYRWFLARGTPIAGSDGQVTRWFGTCTDIQELVEARNLLSRSREQLEREVEERTRELDRILSVSEDLFVVCGPDGRFVSANPAWAKALGQEPEKLVGRAFRDLVEPDDAERFSNAMAALAQGGGAQEVDLRLKRNGGGFRWYTWSWIAEGEAIYGSGRDVTERNQLEAQLRQAQKMETVGKLTGGVAHDFNNLLQVISGNLQLLTKDVAGNPRAETRVQNALAGVSRGSKLASQLLAFGRRQPLEPKVVNVGRLVAGLEDMLRRTLGDAIDVETVISGGLWNTVVDPAQVENALLNLAINARDAMDGVGKLTIEAGNAYLDDAYARAHAEVTPGQYVVVAVTDTGCGMTPDILAQVFEPFFSTKPEGKGTGLGLSMVYGFVKQSGGHVKIYSEPGQGTTVKLYLPRSTAKEDVLVAADTGPVKGGAETILVAEDDEEVRATAVEMLTELGYKVLKAKDAASALSIIESGIQIDLLFTDVVMPGELRSPELARRAKERLPNIAVLFTSGYTENAIVHGGRLDPGVELLGKPYTQEALARKIRHVLANQQQRNQAVSATRPAPLRAAELASVPRRTVLLVEDDDLIRANTAEMLQGHGQVVVEAANAEEALLALQTTTIDVLITDLGLPGLSGRELATRARELRPGIGLIFATGSDLVEGANEDAVLLRKPYDTAGLGAALKSVARIQVETPESS